CRLSRLMISARVALSRSMYADIDVSELTCSAYVWSTDSLFKSAVRDGRVRVADVRDGRAPWSPRRRALPASSDALRQAAFPKGASNMPASPSHPSIEVDRV